ncbi:probable F420-dependent oxidoreductase, Rv3520c family [Amycolatopsis arida]|uniref:Probable F420-dependent oxidoreductase, Rv3520c family n=1 Tax=Amycolatopsis arida TaxID=587909 RepID=A0A1I5Z248_9PSEU|nr:LLM class flavin-dependent oxidoreductase [Amycolatopsis arida]TDX90061.1 F420-dependent oxidoreductase-like protein [Amycolatopsis arida]SFQ50574.1 probable F420-dependent oxidoreductase, Rv3520c family [Amycolatopsis arida]
MRLGLALGYSGEPMSEVLPAVQAADRVGYDSVWSLEEFGPDGVTILGYLAAKTERIKLGTGVLQVAPRTPALTSMTATTLDALSGQRTLLGLGLSQPWLIEGWHGLPFHHPTDVLREYVTVLRKAIAREGPLEFEGRYYQIPYRGPHARGVSRPLKALYPPPRTEIPIYLGTTGPRNVALTGEIADGWLVGGLYIPEHEKVCLAPLEEGIARAGRRRSDVTIAKVIDVIRDDDLDAARAEVRAVLASYLGPRGVGVRNVHFEQACEMGWEAAAHRVRALFTEGRRKEAAAEVPDELVDQYALLGPLDRIIDRLVAWKESRVDVLVLLTRDVELIEAAQAAL